MTESKIDSLTAAALLLLIEERLGEIPEWLQYFAEKEGLRESCLDCAAKIGDTHYEGCDWARCQVCGYQRLSCDCESGGRCLDWNLCPRIPQDLL